MDCVVTIKVPDRTRFRALAARANYLAADRIDILCAGKEISRFMAKPTDVAMGALKRLARYLRSRPRMVFSYERQSADSIDVYTDTDWAGCVRTRKSTSGGCIMVDRHLLKAWSSTQASLASSWISRIIRCSKRGWRRVRNASAI